MASGARRSSWRRVAEEGQVYGLVRDAAKAINLTKNEVKVIVGSVDKLETFADVEASRCDHQYCIGLFKTRFRNCGRQT